MKVVAFNGSPRENGNTSILIKAVFKVLKKENIETELIWLGNKPLQGCIACYKCRKNLDKQCGIKNDLINDYIQKMLKADGIILGSPVYVGAPTANMRALIERAGFVATFNKGIFKRKVGASIAATFRSAGSETLNSMNAFFIGRQMILPCSSYYTYALGIAPGEVEQDKLGIQAMTDLRENMAWLLKKLHS